MPKKIAPLSAKSIQNAKAKDSNYELNDGDGLILRISKNGSKIWILRYYKPYTKKRTNFSFGKYPDVSLAEARKKRGDAKKLLSQKIDPRVHNKNQEQKHANTFKMVALNWFKVRKKEILIDSANDIWNSFENHIFKRIGDIPKIFQNVLHKARKKIRLST